MKCQSCGSTKMIKYGFQGKKNPKQRYRCKDCKRQQAPDSSPRGIPQHFLEPVINSLHERMSLRAICRVFGLALSTVKRFSDKVMAASPADLNAFKTSDLDLENDDIEIDEMATYERKKINKIWIWIAVHRKSRQVLAFVVGGRNRYTCERLWKKLQDMGVGGPVHTDGYGVYASVIPKEQHRPHFKRGETNRVEGLNLRWRQRVSNLVRKTVSYAKCLIALKFRLQAAFGRWNAALQ